MSFTSEVIEFESERERLLSEMEDNTDEQTEIALNDETGVASDYLTQLQNRGTTLQQYRNILNGWADEELGVSKVEITGLTFGDSLFLQDLLDDNPGVNHTPAFVAIGTVDGPYLEHNPESFKRERDAVLETVSNVNDLPIPFVRWLEERIGDKSHLGEDMGNEYTNLLVGKLMDKATEDGESG